VKTGGVLVKNKHSLTLILFTLSLATIMTGCSVAASWHKFASDAEVPRISLKDAKADFDAGNAIFVDTRGGDAWKQERIKGSINIPVGSDYKDFLQLPRGRKVILYCSCPSEHSSAAVAFEMNQKEIPDVYALVGGTNAWKSAGYPMEGSDTANK